LKDEVTGDNLQHAWALQIPRGSPDIALLSELTIGAPLAIMGGQAE